VLGDVPKDQRCRCREEKAQSNANAPSFFERLFGKS
jgi:hypothetical protein